MNIRKVQLIEMQITGRAPSTTPAKAVNKVLHVKATDEAHKETFVQEVHWTYGTAWGLARSALDLAGMRGVPATLAHFGGVWGTALAMLPAIDVAPPPWRIGKARRSLLTVFTTWSMPLPRAWYTMRSTEGKFPKTCDI